MKALILCAALVVPMCAQNHAAWKDKPFAGDPAEMLKASQSFPAVDNADVQILLNHIEKKFDSNGAATLRLWRIFRVLTADGAKEWGTVSASWQPWHEDRPVIRARAITADGSVHEIDPATIAESAERADEPNVLRDGKRLNAPIPAMAVDTVVEEEVLERETKPAYEGGSMVRFSMDFEVPVQWSRVIAESPAGLPLRYTLNKLPETALTKTTEAGVTRLVLERGPFVGVEEIPPLLPSSAARYHGISLSTGESWQRFAERYSAAVDAQIEGANLKSWTSNLNGSREEKISALMARLHKEIRYTGIEFGEAAIVPHKPSEVLARKLGDCKDKASLLVALLRATGIQAHVALLSSGSGQDIDPALPGGGLFNHAIVYVPGTPEYWIDATDEFAKLGETDDDNQGRWALVASPQTTGLKMIPEGEVGQNLTLEKREFFLPDFGASRSVEATEVHGSRASGFRQYYSSRDQKTIKEGLEEYVKDEYLTEALDKWEIGDARDLAHPFHLRLETSKAKRGSVELQSAAIGIPVARLTDSLPKYFTTDPESKKAKKTTAPRTEEFVLRQPYSKEWRYQITVPEGFGLRKTPEAGTTRLGVATLTKEFGPLKDGVMTATLRFESGKTHLTPEEAEATRKAVLELRKAPMPLIQFEQNGEALLTQGKVLEALAEFRTLCTSVHQASK